MNAEASHSDSNYAVIPSLPNGIFVNATLIFSRVHSSPSMCSKAQLLGDSIAYLELPMHGDDPPS